MRIGVFDSGIGGLTVLKSLINKHPNHQYFYFGDTINLPYGEKTKEQLKEYSDRIINFLLSKHVDTIVIACGTISSNLYDDIINVYDINIIDVINPTINHLNKNNDYEKIGIIGTNMTIKSKVFENKMNKSVITQSCPMFVPLIENNLIETEQFRKSLIEYLDKFKQARISALVLGCTHYPIIKEQIEEYLGQDIDLIDLGEIIANNIMLLQEDTGKIELYFSKIDNNLIKNVQNIIGNHEIIEKRL